MKNYFMLADILRSNNKVKSKTIEHEKLQNNKENREKKIE
jgi:hypothetical protein